MNAIQIFTEKQIMLLQKFVENPTPSALANIQSFIEQQEDDVKSQQINVDSMVSIPLFPVHQQVISYMEKFEDENKFLRIDQCDRIIQDISPALVSFREFLFRCEEFARVIKYTGKYQNFRAGHIGISENQIHIRVPFFVRGEYFYDRVVARFHFLKELEEKYAYGNTLKLKGE